MSTGLVIRAEQPGDRDVVLSLVTDAFGDEAPAELLETLYPDVWWRHDAVGLRHLES